MYHETETINQHALHDWSDGITSSYTTSALAKKALNLDSPVKVKSNKSKSVACNSTQVAGLYARDSTEAYGGAPFYNYDYVSLSSDGTLLALYTVQLAEIDTGTTATPIGVWTCSSNGYVVATTFNHDLFGPSAGLLDPAGGTRRTDMLQVGLDNNNNVTLTSVKRAIATFDNGDNPFDPNLPKTVIVPTNPIPYTKIKVFVNDLN